MQFLRGVLFALLAFSCRALKNGEKITLGIECKSVGDAAECEAKDECSWAGSECVPSSAR